MVSPGRITSRRTKEALRIWATIAGAMCSLLAGCVSAADIAAPSQPAPKQILVPISTLRGALLSAELDLGGTPSPSSGIIAFQQFVRPVAVAGREPDIYIADVGFGVVYRLDSRFGVMAVLPGVHARLGIQLHTRADLSIYVLDQPNRRVSHYSRSGQLLATFSDDLNIGRPVDVAWDERRGRVLVADALYNHLVAFHALGRASYVIRLRGKSGDRVFGIAGMATSAEEIFLSDPVCQCIARVSMDGEVVETFGDRFFGQPGPIAVDRHQRVFVVDTFDSSLKIFFQGELIEELSAAKLGLQQLNDIWIRDGWVILSGGVGATVKIMRLAAGPPY